MSIEGDDDVVKREQCRPEGRDDPHGIGARLEALGIRVADLARRIGVDHQRIEALLRTSPSGRIPAGYALPLVLRALDALEAGADAAASGDLARAVSAPGPQLRQHAAAKGQTVVFLTSPVSGGYVLTEITNSFARVPESIENVEGVFGVVVRDSSMAPLWRPGDRLILNPAGVPQLGTGIALLGADKALVLREYADETADAWIVKRYGREPGEEKISKEKFPRLLTVAAIYPGR